MLDHDQAQPKRASHGAAPTLRPNRLRLLGTALVGVLLLGTAFQAAASGVAGLGGRYADDGDGGIGAGSIAGIAVGAGLGIAAATGVLGGAPDDCRERRPALPERITRLSEIRLSPQETTLDAGECRCFFLEVRAADDNKWYSVTENTASTLELQSQTECLVKRDGQKNVFCVPIDASGSCDGKTVVVVGTYTPPGQAPMRASARVEIRVKRQETQR